MAITTTPTAAMKTAIKAVFTSEFGGGSPPSTEDAIGTAMANVIAKAIELALVEVKTNAVALDGTQGGGDSLDID